MDDINWKRNVGKFKVGDIIGGYNKGFWKIAEINTQKGRSSSGELHICVSFNPETGKCGQARASWCSIFSRTAEQEIKNQREFFQKKLDKVERQAKALGL